MVRVSPATPDASAKFNDALATAYQEIPRYVQYTSPVPNGATNAQPTATTLPLNLILLIISYLDDIGDIARVTRTSRLLYYLTLPQLYERVVLHSYPELRYVGNRVEGYGGGSPFMMALNGLVTKNHAQLVKHLRLWGVWKETAEEDFGKGRVPDGTMMLNILLHAALDKMTKLQSFSWELDCKPMKTLYQGLAAHEQLTSLTLRFPSSRSPRPCVVMPALRNLRAFKAFDIDPMCYPDDISVLLLDSKKLEDLRLHFSPRFRREAEPSLRLDHYFGRCERAGYRPKLKHFGIQNFIGHAPQNLDPFHDERVCTSVCIFDSFGATEGDPRTLYLEQPWREGDKECYPQLASIRTNQINPVFVRALQKMSQTLRRFMIISAKGFRGTLSAPDTTPNANTPITSQNSPAENTNTEVIELCGPYIDVLTRFHGQSLRHLLLPDQWALSQDELCDLVRGCPNLTQFGFAFGDADHSVIRILAPFLRRIEALRLLKNAQLEDHLRLLSHDERMKQISADVGRSMHRDHMYIAFGDTIYHVGRHYETAREDGTVAKLREIRIVDQAAVQHLAIWGLDNLNIDADVLAAIPT